MNACVLSVDVDLGLSSVNLGAPPYCADVGPVIQRQLHDFCTSSVSEAVQTQDMIWLDHQQDSIALSRRAYG